MYTLFINQSSSDDKIRAEEIYLERLRWLDALSIGYV